jgi:hypothetical protein
MNRFTAIGFQVFLLSVARATDVPVSDAPAVLANDDIPHTLLPPMAPVETGNYWSIALISIAVVAILLLILVLFLRKRYTQPIAKPLSSFKLFLRDLHRARLHAETKDTKEFCTALCFALKSYVQREYQLPITCRTTEEFLKIVQNSSKFSWEFSSDLTDILQYSDQAKFAGELFPPNFHRDLFLKTCRFVREVKRIRHPIKAKIKPVQK